MNQQLRILEGATFCICDELGDLHGKVEGLFAQDTRFLSGLRLTINGQRPGLLSSDKIEYFSAAFFMRNPLAGGLGHDVLSIRRERFVGDGMQDSFTVQNESMERVEFDLELDVAADFADIFAVKDYDFALGNPMGAKPLPEPRPVEYEEERNQFLISDDGDLPLKTQVIFSERGKVNGSTMTFHLSLEPRERWGVHVEVFPLARRWAACATRSRRGNFACRSSARRGTRSRIPSGSPSPTSPRCGCVPTTAGSASCRAPACRGS